MNWDAIGAVGEILGALAVVVTLFYLARQVRQNTIVTRAETTKDLYLASVRSIMDLAGNEQLTRTWADIRQFPDLDHTRRWAVFQSFFRLYELQHNFNRQGLLDPDIADAYQRVVHMFGGSRHFPEYWAAARETFSPEFAAWVDDQLREIGHTVAP